ncbi:MAG: hypothetical protein PUB43_03940, partial [Oscillospiraceae bacterium]|nr:hypothetical protein [Oscillospiraceae bacterium]
MGRLKDYYDDYIMDDPQLYLPLAFRETVNDWLEEDIPNPKEAEELRTFLEEVTPTGDYDYFLFVAASDGTHLNIKCNRENYMHHLCCLSQRQVTLFYHLAAFKGWTKDSNAQASQCLYLDIDDVGINAENATYELASKIFREDYQLPEELLPDYVIFSGHGMHICYLTEVLYPQDEEIRKKYLHSMITHFQADFSGAPVSHKFRTPTSYNLKDDTAIKGKLFRLNNSNDRNLKRLDFFLKSPEEIEDYKHSYYRRITEKGNETRLLHANEEVQFIQKVGDRGVTDYVQSHTITEAETAIAKRLIKREQKKKIFLRDQQAKLTSDDVAVPYEKALPYRHLDYYHNFQPENRDWNLLFDLHNYFIRHKGILPSRNMFFTIIASIMRKKNYAMYYCLKYCRKYVDDSYYNSMCEVIKNVYNGDSTYHYRLTTIADWLCFDEEDIRKSYCHFSEEKKKAARQKVNQTYYQKSKAQKGKSDFQ